VCRALYPNRDGPECDWGRRADLSVCLSIRSLLSLVHSSQCRCCMSRDRWAGTDVLLCLSTALVRPEVKIVFSFLSSLTPLWEILISSRLHTIMFYLSRSFSHFPVHPLPNPLGMSESFCMFFSFSFSFSFWVAAYRYSMCGKKQMENTDMNRIWNYCPQRERLFECLHRGQLIRMKRKRKHLSLLRWSPENTPQLARVPSTACRQDWGGREGRREKRAGKRGREIKLK
jgi:hypothetical protein